MLNRWIDKSQINKTISGILLILQEREINSLYIVIIINWSGGGENNLYRVLL